MEDDLKWTFSKYEGFFVPVYDKNGYIQGLSVHLDKPFNDNRDIWFSSNARINGTPAKSWVSRSNIDVNTEKIYITDNFLLGHFLKDALNVPTISFQNISNSYLILNEIEGTEIRDITFVVRLPQSNKNLDYIINRIIRDLISKGYNIDTKYVRTNKDFFDDNFSVSYTLKKAI